MKTINILKSTRGEGHIDTGIKIIIAVVIGALILGGLYVLFATVILPNLSDEVDAMMEHGENGAVVQRVLDEQSGTYVLKYSYDGKHWNPAQMPNYGDGSSVYNMISGGTEGNTQQAALVKKDNTYYLIASSDGVNWSEQFSFTGNSITHFYYGTSDQLPRGAGSFSGEAFVIRWHSGGSTYFTGVARDATSWVKPTWSDLILL